MKCPKCGYVSFDHNQVCPKCSKDILAEQRRLNLPDYQADPPFFLSALTGEGDAAEGVAPSPREPSRTIEFGGALQSTVRNDELPSGGEILPAESESAIPAIPVKAQDDELELDLDELSLDSDDGEAQGKPGPFKFESQSPEEDAISLDFGDLKVGEEKSPSNGFAVSDEGELGKAMALDGTVALEENQMGLNTAEMLTLELDRKLDAASSEITEDELEEFEFDIDLDELKDVKE